MNHYVKIFKNSLKTFHTLIQIYQKNLQKKSHLLKFLIITLTLLTNLTLKIKSIQSNSLNYLNKIYQSH